MPSRRHTFYGSRPTLRAPTAHESAAPLGGRLCAVLDDRVSTSEDLVLEACGRIRAWVLQQPEAWSWERAGGDLEAELRAFDEEQGWRGPCAVWIDSLRRAWHCGRALSQARPEVSARDILAEELGLWLASRDLDRGAAPGTGVPRPNLESTSLQWTGEPLAAGRRWPAREDLARHAATVLERGEVLLVNAFSNTIALALQAAQRAGKRPHALIADGVPFHEGQRMAERLAPAGIPVTLCYDACLPANLPRADRVWLSTEAIGSEALLARVGTRFLVEEADRQEVPVQVLATSDKLMPGGRLSLPKFCERDTTLLWEEAPLGVRLESQAYEAVSLDLLPQFVTEIGAETATALHLRALRVEVAPPCAPETPTLNLST